ncbi:hypothetical protein P3G55_24625 [Leptospira sp. 96542]|nr:hypothetical protein [Leptospira sp. 96542]
MGTQTLGKWLQEGERVGTGSHPMRFEISAEDHVVKEKSVFLVPR